MLREQIGEGEGFGLKRHMPKKACALIINAQARNKRGEGIISYGVVEYTIPGCTVTIALPLLLL
jgi:hypothetical protein